MVQIANRIRPQGPRSRPMRAGPREQISMAGPAGSCRCTARWMRGPGRRAAHRRRPHELNALWGQRSGRQFRSQIERDSQCVPARIGFNGSFLNESFRFTGRNPAIEVTITVQKQRLAIRHVRNHLQYAKPQPAKRREYSFRRVLWKPSLLSRVLH